MQYKILVLCLVLFSSILRPQSGIQHTIDSLLTDSFFDSTLIAVDIYNLSKDESIYRKNEKLLLRPASNMKVVTTAAALIFLTPEYEFETSLYYKGKISRGILRGDVFIKGGCDPDFTSDSLSSFISAIKERGIKKISGRLLGDISFKDSLFWGSGWMWDDDPSTDAPYLSALNINSNSISIRVSLNDKGKVVVNSYPETKFIKIINKVKVVDSVKNNLKISRDWLNRTNTFIVEGEIQRNDLREKVSSFNVYNPHLYFLQLMKEELQRNGISVLGTIDTAKIPENAELIAKSVRKFSNVIVNLNKTSDNLSAEMTLLAMSKIVSNEPASSLRGKILVDSLILLCGLMPDNYRIEDGSGVSHYNLISAELLRSVLTYIYKKDKKVFSILEQSFPFAGIDGTLKSRMKGSIAEGNVKAKTGTLSGISCLSGYVTGVSGDKYAFSIMVQNHVRKTYRALEYQNKICQIIAGN